MEKLKEMFSGVSMPSLSRVWILIIVGFIGSCIFLSPVIFKAYNYVSSMEVPETTAVAGASEFAGGNLKSAADSLSQQPNEPEVQNMSPPPQAVTPEANSLWMVIEFKPDFSKTVEGTTFTYHLVLLYNKVTDQSVTVGSSRPVETSVLPEMNEMYRFNGYVFIPADEPKDGQTKADNYLFHQ